MRVTEITKRESIVKNIQQNAQRLKTLQTEMASGQKINKVTDDPVGATVVQDVITTVARKEQMQHNMSDNLVWLNNNEVQLQHMADLLTKAKNLVISQAGSSASNESQRVTAQELKDIRESIFDAGNARQNKLFLFSGTKTFTKPLEYANPLQPAKVQTEDIVQKDVADLLDVSQFKAQFDGHSLNKYRVKITKSGPLGYARYRISDDDGATWGQQEILNPTVKVYNAKGKTNDQVTLKFTDDQGLLGDILPDNFSFSGDNLAFFDTADQGVIFPEGMEFVFLSNPPVVYAGNHQSKEAIIANGVSIPINITAAEILLKTGEDSVDIFQMFLALENALEKNDSTALGQRLEEMDHALEQVLKKQANVGNTMIDIENALHKIDEQVYSTQQRLSDVQDVDLAKASIDLNTAEVNNKVSLNAGGRLIQPSLLEFLR